MCYPLAGYRAHQTGLQAETKRICWSHLSSADSRLTGYRVYRLQEIYRLQRDLLVPPSQCWQQAHRSQRFYRLVRDLLVPPFQCWQQAHRSQSLPVTGNLPVTEKSAGPTIPVLPAGSPLAEFTGYREFTSYRNLLVPSFQYWHQPHQLQRTLLFPPLLAEGNFSQQIQWGQRGHQLQRIAGDSQIDRKFFS